MTGTLPSSRVRSGLLAAALMVATFAAYSPALRAVWVWDDWAIFRNPLLSGFDGLINIWTRPSANANEVHYWPLTYTVFWIINQVAGMKPAAFHFVNVALHASNAVLLWLLLRRLAISGAWFAAAVFALHPVRVESVAWCIELKDVLSGFFYLAAFLLYQISIDGRHRWQPAYFAALACFAMSLLSKSVGVTLPVALLIVAWWRDGRLTRPVVMRTLPFFVMALLIVGADLLVVGQLEKNSVALTTAVRVIVAGRAFWFYLSKLLWPMELSAVYPAWIINAREWWLYLYPAATALFLLRLVMARRTIGRAPGAAFLFYAITLAPTLGFVPFSFMRVSWVADRFQYLAAIGPLTLAVGGAAWALRNASPSLRRTATGGAIVVCALLGVLTWRQAATWRNVQTLFEQAARVAPDSPVVHHNLGDAALSTNRPAEAVTYYTRVMQLEPAYTRGHVLLGDSLRALRKSAEAVRQYRIALRLDPDNAAARDGLRKLLSSGDHLTTPPEWEHKP
ncbi:MAG: tetratricopeptide repeat protein [Candidatus Sumerlaeaceae bacterium]|nr:tetratricopeptide repeat protein [Candidatus Sumerlaeaceae bacterium]